MDKELEFVPKVELGEGVTEAIESVVPAEVFAPAAPEPAGFPWGGVGIGVLVVAGIAIVTKFLSD